MLPRMTSPTLTIDTLRILAAERGLSLTDPELERLLPLVQATRSGLDALREIPRPETEPAAQFRML